VPIRVAVAVAVAVGAEVLFRFDGKPVLVLLGKRPPLGAEQSPSMLRSVPAFAAMMAQAKAPSRVENR
jgi:hypothetical protein